MVGFAPVCSAPVADFPLDWASAAFHKQVPLLLQTLIIPGDRVPEGKLIEAVTVPWFEIIAALEREPSVAFAISPEKWEEIVAGAYKRAGFDEVVLTPRSGDHGRDVIAIKRGLGEVRVIDQVKAY